LDNLFRLGQRTGSRSQFAVSYLHDDERAPSISILTQEDKYPLSYVGFTAESSSVAAPLRQSTIRLSSMAGDCGHSADHVWTKVCPRTMHLYDCGRDLAMPTHVGFDHR
jgi:hypothetical protein